MYLLTIPPPTARPRPPSYSVPAMAAPKTSERMSADERREAVLEAAMTEFALGGLHGTSGEAIASRAGISQPYLFRLFGTKKELFLAVVDRVFDRMLRALDEGLEA